MNKVHWTLEYRYCEKILTSFPLHIYPEVELLKCMVVLFVILWGSSILFATVLHQFYIPTNSAPKFPFHHMCPFVPSEFCVRWVLPIRKLNEIKFYLLKIRWLIRAVLALLDFIYSECFKADFLKNCFFRKRSSIQVCGLQITILPVKILVHFGFFSNLMYFCNPFAFFKRDNQWSFSTLGQFLYYPRI